MGLKPEVSATLLTPVALFLIGLLLANPQILLGAVFTLFVASLIIGVWRGLYYLLGGK